ncbi:F-box/kelch-repeat protein At3g23880-like [Lotus japonicus]|uniref:F-box/kelch-repeat protein At3g23880-like n=1 Tax=Lotus japonicus TaxID=34305 RepID=UPI00258A70B3|nr:F-box/kelch-repeat protein At3g23880-like [Lotus japonicus]
MEKKETEKKKKKPNLNLTELIPEMIDLSHEHANKRMMINDKENQNTVSLPDDLIPLILVRLPVRSLLRFKSVCKSWLSLISNTQFAKSHFDLAAAPTHRLLLKRINVGSEIQSLDFEASLRDDSAVVNLKFPPYSAPFYLALGSCRGLILLAKMMGPSAGDLIVWNPSNSFHREIQVTYGYDDWDSWYDPSSTRVRQGIPPYVGCFLTGFLYGFGYDQSRDDYLLVLLRFGRHEPQPQAFEHSREGLLVCMTTGGPEVTTFSRPRVEVLSVKTNVPSFIYGEEFEYVELGSASASGLFLNKSLHWLVKSKATGLHVIIAFDLVERSLFEIPLTPDLTQELATLKIYHLRVLGGCLGLCCNGAGVDHGMTEIWVMKEYRVQSSWTRYFVLPEYYFLPICFIEGGGVFGSNNSGRFEKFDDNGELLEDHTYGQENEDVFGYFDMYKETLLTLPGELS